jgi:hypothetical protein
MAEEEERKRKEEEMTEPVNHVMGEDDYRETNRHLDTQENLQINFSYFLFKL